MAYNEYPRRARFGNGREKFPAVPVDFTLAYGNRAQRRHLLRTLKHKKGGKK
ncbi:MAG: hypothetical protein AMXMBFR31_28410 [Candidatus Desulfobacillus denitrificans]